MKWTSKIVSGYYKGLKLKCVNGASATEFMLDIESKKNPKVHWCMKLDRGWGKKKKPYVRVQCQTGGTKYMMYLEDYDIPVEYKCKHCHKQWLKTKDIIENLENYKFYDMDKIKIFLCKASMTSFSNFNIDYMYMSCENNQENWTEEITHAFNKHVSCRDLMNMDKIYESKRNIKFWKRYYKLRKA